jgi:hypothetical protein
MLGGTWAAYTVILRAHSDRWKSTSVSLLEVVLDMLAVEMLAVGTLGIEGNGMGRPDEWG